MMTCTKHSHLEGEDRPMTDKPSLTFMPQVGRADSTTWIENKTILTPTGGFLAPGFTHTLNPFVGCAFAGALCGTFCYAQFQAWIQKDVHGPSMAPSAISGRPTSMTTTASNTHGRGILARCAFL
jgi:hypothetical protein